MQFSSRKEGSVLVFDLVGGLEGGPDSYEIKDVVTELLKKGERNFLLNLDKVDFINSTGIGIIASVFSSISNAGGDLKICSANDRVSKVMMITKLLEVFDSHTTEQQALEAFQSA